MAVAVSGDTSFIRRLGRPSQDELGATVEQFLSFLAGPSWIEVPGLDHSRRRLVATLLHGNEPSSIRAVHNWLRAEHQPAVDTVFYVGSVAAALKAPGFAHRTLPDERDANRCYGPYQDDVQGRIAREFEALFARQNFEAVVDIHNNTGHNPAYGIGYGVDEPRLNLTHLFADWYVLSDLCMHTMVEMTGQHCPSISVECGRAGDPAADAVALAGLDRFLHLEDLALNMPAPHQLRLLKHPRRVHLRPHLNLAFAETAQIGVDLTLRDDLDRHNFAELSAGSVLGWIADEQAMPLLVDDTDGKELATSMFLIEGGELKTRQPMIPIMMTTNAEVVRSDCLFYAVETGELI